MISCNGVYPLLHTGMEVGVALLMLFVVVLMSEERSFSLSLPYGRMTLTKRALQNIVEIYLEQRIVFSPIQCTILALDQESVEIMVNLPVPFKHRTLLFHHVQKELREYLHHVCSVDLDVVLTPP